MKHDLSAALDQCLEWAREGREIESCLARYPEHVDALGPLLEVATELARVHVSAPQVTARVTGQRRMLASLAQKQERQARVHPVFRFARRLLWTVAPGRPGSLSVAPHFIGQL